MTLDDFKLEQLTIQINYPDAYSLWDSAGTLASQISEVWPGLTLENAEPGEIALKSESYKVLFGIRMAYINLMTHKAFDDFSDSLTTTFKLWVKHLSIKNFNRIGARAVYSKDFVSAEKAATALKQLDLIKWPKEKIFNIDPSIHTSIPSLLFKFEDNENGVTVRVNFQSVKLEVNLGKEFDQKVPAKEKFKILIDIDRYTTKTTKTDSLNVVEWLKGYKHLVRRDIPTLLGFKS